MTRESRDVLPLSKVSSNDRLLEAENDGSPEPSNQMASSAYHDDPGRGKGVGPRTEEVVYADGEARDASNTTAPDTDGAVHTQTKHRAYRRRFFGLFQLTLLNVIVSWDWLTFAPVSTSSAQHFGVSENAINWLSTGFLFAFVAATPVTIKLLHLGPRPAIIASSVLILIGNWIRYGGTRAGPLGNFGAVVFGQILIGFAQPFLLCAPTRYSDLWFTDRGRISATAVMSLANPLGGALGQLIDPFMATKSAEIPNMVLYISIISSVAAVPSFFVPAKPPTPPSASSSQPQVGILASLKMCLSNTNFWLIFAPYSVYVGFFNALSSLLNQILGPYGFSEDDAGICGAILIVVGLIAAAILSPVVDRTKTYLSLIKTLVPLIASSYLVFIWMPQTRTLVGPYVVAAILGASSFALVPVALEYLVEVTWPASPEVGSTLCWTGGQLLGGIFIIIMDALKDDEARDGATTKHGARPANNMYRALVFEAVIGLLVLPLPLMLGWARLGFGDGKQSKRLDAERGTGERAPHPRAAGLAVES